MSTGSKLNKAIADNKFSIVEGLIKSGAFSAGDFNKNTINEAFRIGGNLALYLVSQGLGHLCTQDTFNYLIDNPNYNMIRELLEHGYSSGNCTLETYLSITENSNNKSSINDYVQEDILYLLNRYCCSEDEIKKLEAKKSCMALGCNARIPENPTTLNVYVISSILQFLGPFNKTQASLISESIVFKMF